MRTMNITATADIVQRVYSSNKAEKSSLVIYSGIKIQTSSKCGIGKVRPTGYAVASLDTNRNRVTNQYREYECDTCASIPKEANRR